ncbi:hypothetical protein CC78DRAFT_138211 [Lojkania enalia]|uniref:Uncharacterized protein n=1 Tax=Lojkania enalia TaxID=147567 RepID=A0A9P4NCD0_9PLEO|nr:hypothetical protein CC78DRAFT_138211 [Didymosphaeria enalia]
MAKKKGRKNQKPVEWVSPPPSPKPAPEGSPPLPEATPLSPQTVATETTQEDFQSIASPTEPRSDDFLDNSTISNPTIQNESTHALIEESQIVERETENPTTPTKEAKPESTAATILSTEAEPSKEPEESKLPDEALTTESSLPALVDVSPSAETPALPEPEQTKRTDETALESTSESKQLIEEVTERTLLPATIQETVPEAELAEPAPDIETVPKSTAAVPEAVPGAAPEPQPEAQSSEAAEPPAVAQNSEPQVDIASSKEPQVVIAPTEPDQKDITPAPLPAPARDTEAAPVQLSPPPLPIEEPVQVKSPPVQSPSTRSPSVRSPRPQSPPVKSPPKPEAVKHAVEDSRPPAPTPPVSRVRPRHSSAFEDDDGDDDSDDPLIQPRLRGELSSRDHSRGLTYPPHPSHPRLFASRVPSEHYSNPPPPPPPPGYHPRYYPPGAPPYYHSHNHSMSQSPYGPSSHASSPYQETWNQFPPTYPTYGSPPIQRHDSVGSREYPLGPLGHESSSAIEDDTVDLFSRISQAIPDLHVLLARYKETHGQLGVREELLRRASLEQQEKLRNKDDEINTLKEKINHLENKHSADANRLRLEIGNMEEQMKELREQIAETDKLREELDVTRKTLAAAKESWEAKQKELEIANTALEKTIVAEKEKAQNEFEEWKSTTTTKHDAEKIALAIQFDKKLKEADVLADTQRQEAAAAYIKEKDELRSEHQRQQREREANFDRVRKELETKLSTAQKDREEALKHERESREVWEAERETLIKAYDEDRKDLQKGWDEQRGLMEAQYKKNKDESDKAWIELHAEANKRAEEEKAKVEILTKERDDLQKRLDDLKAEHQKDRETIRVVASNLENEKARLEKLMECYGDMPDIKSKGDTYYLVSFSQLQKQIIDLATTHFKHLPVSPPPDDLAQIPSGLPSFLGDTLASRQLRAAYIAHTVSKMVTFRVFGPFLFSLGRRYDKADSLFSSMSHHIREKSTRREAIWRQQTLLAAFTSSGAKQRINTAAGTVVDEIVAAIKNFADPKEEEAIRIAVRRIVKLAAETWRFARLEREMIVATMPALQDEEHEFTGPNFWPAYRPEDTPIASLVGTDTELNDNPKLLLRLFPVVRREPKHEIFSSESEKPDEGCIYHYGLALYDDAKPVVTRIEELKSAGLPPINHSSPTAADFPPPIIPPPRNPPPAPPSTSISIVTEEVSPPPPPPTEPADPLSFLEPSPPEPSKPPYTRPIPVPIQTPSTPDVSPTPLPTARPDSTVLPQPVPTPPSPAPPLLESDESASHQSSTLKPTKDVSPLPPPTENVIPPPPPSYTRDLSPLPRATESATEPPPVSIPTSHTPPLPAPTESAILPPTFPIPGSSSTQPQSRKDVQNATPEASPPTPPRSREPTPTPRPVSPLFAAEDEIEGLKTHSNRKTSLSRRSTPSKSSSEELRKDKGEHISRRTSGYTISNKSSMDGGSQRSSSSRYTCESRSAAIKGLYPNSPMAGQPIERHTLRSQKHRSIEGASIDFSTVTASTNEANMDASEHR